MDATHTITKNLGGDRLGSGSKNNISLHAYNRSTHDLSRAWRSSMMPGTLVPFLVEPALPGDTWSIDLSTLVRTLPAIGPLYGSFKLQLDVFECPIRLYNGLLHNNMTKIGMNMAQVKLPKITIKHEMLNPTKYAYNVAQSQVASDALINYLGIRGIGNGVWTGNNDAKLSRKFNAVPLLAYWDIYKNYYANKQEEKGVYISPLPIAQAKGLTELYMLGGNGTYMWNFDDTTSSFPTTLPTPTGDTYQAIIAAETGNPQLNNMPPLGATDYWINYEGTIATTNLEIIYYDISTTTYTTVPITTMFPNMRLVTGMNQIQLGEPAISSPDYYIAGFGYTWTQRMYTEGIGLKTFNLANIDQMRIDILQATGLNNELDIATTGYEPYQTFSKQDTTGSNYNKYKCCGLGIKTYQSDLFNNWLKTEWIDGVNGINQITAIDVSSGSFTIDALNLANKVYNMLNRIAVSGGSYEDYIEAVYTIDTARRAESPVYKGGYSGEIVFEEVVSTAASGQDALGTLAGRGNIAGGHGGNIEIKVDEPSFIIGIVSITPRTDYSQGNAWFMTELDTLDDLHKPALDGIGFEDLLQERMAWWGTCWDSINGEWVKLAAGKVPAWINYMTATNQTYGDFAEEGKTMFMTLNRRYEINQDPHIQGMTGIVDMTTYIDPTKYNYAFADTSLAAQNFWVQIGINAQVRRVMSAKIIPNL